MYEENSAVMMDGRVDLLESPYYRQQVGLQLRMFVFAPAVRSRHSSLIYGWLGPWDRSLMLK